jgi:hypothetical protein
MNGLTECVPARPPARLSVCLSVCLPACLFIRLNEAGADSPSIEGGMK